MNADTLRRLAALKLAPEAMSEVLSIIADMQSVEDERKAKDRERKALYGPEWPSIAKSILERDGLVCHYCGTDEGFFSVDHIQPVSKGGTNDESNLCVACAPCNSSKRDRTLAEWVGRK